jgi:hypothetical protein
MAQPELTGYREAWLQAAASFLCNHIAAHDLPRVNVRVSCGWPVRGGIARRRTVIGQCFPPSLCKDGTPQIFISPRLAESIDVLGTLLHELLHASVGCQHGHKKPFSQAARKVGLAGPPTATIVGESLRPVLLSYVERVGPYPHAAITVKSKEKVGSRLRLYQCGCHPPVKVRVASDTLAAVCLTCDEEFMQVVKDAES